MTRIYDPFDYSQIPEYIKEGMTMYVDNGIPLGSFLTAVFSNDLRKAFSRADEKNIPLIHLYINYIYNCLPQECWGSPEKVASWLKIKEKKND